jgi:hypothetical protein
MRYNETPLGAIQNILFLMRLLIFQYFNGLGRYPENISAIDENLAR